METILSTACVNEKCFAGEASVVDDTRDVLQESQIEAEIVDLHAWRVRKGKFVCIPPLVIANHVDTSDLKQQVNVQEELVHIAIEVNDLSAAPRKCRAPRGRRISDVAIIPSRK